MASAQKTLAKNRLGSLRRSSTVIVNASLRLITGIDPLHAKATIHEFQAFHEYAKHTSHWRIAAVLIFTPFPSLLTSLTPVFIPLQDPSKGVLYNTGWIIHSTIVVLLTFIGVHMVVRVGAGIKHDVITHSQVIIMSMISTPFVIGSAVIVAWQWKFPIPLTWVFCLPFWFNAFIIGFLVVYRTQLWDPQPIRQRVTEYCPLLAAQIMPLGIYTVYCVVFVTASNLYQMVMAVLFPILKHTIKHALKSLNRHRSVEGKQIASQAVEICASMFQSMVLQTSPSVSNTVIIMATDVILQLIHLRLFMNPHHSVIESDKLIETAHSILSRRKMNDDELRRFSTPIFHKRMASPAKKVKSNQVAIDQFPTLSDLPPPSLPAMKNGPTPLKVSVHPPGNSPTTTDLSVQPLSKKPRLSVKYDESDEGKKKIVVRALEIMQSSESLLFIEYLEVIIPIISSIFVAIASQVPSAIYNSKLSPYYCKPESLIYASSNIAFFFIMQALSLLGLGYVIWKRFRLPAIIHLAYVLERRKWAVQGHMIAWFAVILHFSVKHYGAFEHV